MGLIDFAKKLDGRVGEPQGFKLIRTLGSQAFSELGWPTKKLEAWKYSPVTRLQGEFIPDFELSDSALPEIDSLFNEFSHELFHPIVFYRDKIIYLAAELQEKVNLYPIKEAVQKGFLDSSNFNSNNDSLEALNISFFENGFYLQIPEKVQIRRPIHLIQLAWGEKIQTIFQSRLHIDIGPGAECTIVESHLSNKNGPSVWSNSSTNISVGDHATLNLCQWTFAPSHLQLTHRTRIQVGSHSQLHGFHGTLCSGWNRSQHSVDFCGEQASATLHTLGGGLHSGVLDQQSQITFKKPFNKAQQLCKNLLHDESLAIFNGRIAIHNSAQQTEASQLHKSLLLSARAQVDTKPELEIYADDVKATHGAAIGSLNSEEIFYLQSRGLSQTRAQELLCHGFLVDLCQQFPHQAVQNFLTHQIQTHWKGAFHGS